MEDLPSRTGAVFNVSDIRKFRFFLIATVIGYRHQLLRRKRWVVDREEGRSKHATHPLPYFFPISNGIIANIINASESTANRLKLRAVKCKYLEVRKDYKPTGIASREYSELVAHLNA